MIELIGTIVIVLVWIKAIFITTSALPLLGLGFAGVVMLGVSAVGAVALGIIWGGAQRS